MKEILLCRNYLEDKRTSMEVYANNFSEKLGGLAEFDQYRPHTTIKSIGMGGVVGRIERYIKYPLTLPPDYKIYHVLDHGYAHLRNAQKKSKWVLTCHDLIPYISYNGYAKGLNKVRRPIFSEYSMSSYKNFDKIVAISESTKCDLVRYLNIDPQKIEVIYYGLSGLYRKLGANDREKCKKKYGYPDRWNILICGFQYYKNHETSISIINELSKKYTNDISLIKIGPSTKAWESTKRLISKNIKIKEHDNLEQNEMLELYNGVDCVLFPSWYEGFGWPPVEAMKCGTPAVVSNAASLPEAVGKGGLQYAPDDIFGMAEALERLMMDSNYYQMMSDYGIKHVAKFDWKKNATETYKIYKEFL
jgi:glycosyltransferase involved in cell wall biosynthesis